LRIRQLAETNRAEGELGEAKSRKAEIKVNKLNQLIEPELTFVFYLNLPELSNFNINFVFLQKIIYCYEED